MANKPTKTTEDLRRYMEMRAGSLLEHHSRWAMDELIDAYQTSFASVPSWEYLQSHLNTLDNVSSTVMAANDPAMDQDSRRALLETFRKRY